MKYDIPKRGVSRWVLDHRLPRKKFTCPKCGKKNHFTRYVDAVTGEEAGNDFGICDNTIKCGYKKYPTSDLLPKGTPVLVDSKDFKPEFMINDDPESASCIDPSEVLRYMDGYKDNKLFMYLASLFGYKRTMETMMAYRVGTIDYFKWKGCMLFWQIDKDFTVRTGKIMEYGDNGKRVKGDSSPDGAPHVTFFHCRKYADFNLNQCLFGEHLLNSYPEGQEVNIVEAEKTALACYIKNPKKLYLSVGGLQNIREKTMRVLHDRKIIFFPDKGKAFDMWKKKVSEQIPTFNTVVSDYLERINDLPEGSDLADLIFKEQIEKINKKNNE